MKDRANYVGNNIRSFRAKFRLSQEDMANKMGVSRITYNDYEVNPQKLKIETLMQIADILKCNITDFFVELEVPERNTNENK